MVDADIKTNLEFILGRTETKFESSEDFLRTIKENQIKILPPGLSQEVYQSENAYICPWLRDVDKRSLNWAVQHNKPMILDWDNYQIFREQELKETNPSFTISGEQFDSAFAFPTYAHLTMFMEQENAAILYFADDEINPNTFTGYTLINNQPKLVNGTKEEFEISGKNIFWTAHSFDSIFVPPLYYAIGLVDPIVFTSIKDIFRYNKADIDYSNSKIDVIDPELKPSLPNSEEYEPGVEPSSYFDFIQAIFNHQTPYNTSGLPHQFRGEKLEGNDGGVSIDRGVRMIEVPIREGVHYMQIKEEPEVIRRFKGIGRKGSKNAQILANFYTAVNQKSEFLVKMLKNGSNYLVSRKIIGFTLGEALFFEEEQGFPYLQTSLDLIGYFNRNSAKLLSEEDKNTLINIDYGKVGIDCFSSDISAFLQIPKKDLKKQEPDEIFQKLPLESQNQIIHNYSGLRMARYLERENTQNDLIRDVRFVLAYMHLVNPIKQISMNKYGVWSTDAKPDNIMIDSSNTEAPVLIDPYLEYNLLQKEFVLTVQSPGFIIGAGKRYQEIVDEFRTKYMVAHGIDPNIDQSEYMLSELVSSFEINMMESKNVLTNSSKNSQKNLFEGMSRFNQSMQSLEQIYEIAQMFNPVEAQNVIKSDYEYMVSQLKRAHAIRVSNIVNTSGCKELKEYVSMSGFTPSVIKETINYADSMFGL